MPERSSEPGRRDPRAPGPRSQRGPLNDLYRYSGLGLQFSGAVAVFALAGYWLDGRLGSSPWLLLVGVFLGFGLGLYSLIKKLPTTSARSDDPAPK